MLALLFQKSSFSLSLLNDVINISTYFQLLLKELIFVSLFKVHNSGGVRTREKNGVTWGLTERIQYSFQDTFF